MPAAPDDDAPEINPADELQAVSDDLQMLVEVMTEAHFADVLRDVTQRLADAKARLDRAMVALWGEREEADEAG